MKKKSREYRNVSGEGFETNRGTMYGYDHYDTRDHGKEKGGLDPAPDPLSLACSLILGNVCGHSRDI